MDEDDMNDAIPNEIGVWIECCEPNCKKWRYVRDIDDPLMVPEKWYCYMNSDQSANTCSALERAGLEGNEVFVESKYKAGSIVWAKVIGYPWYPAMVTFCPDFECYYWFDKPRSNIPTQYHVTFFGPTNQSRAWIKSKYIKPFIGNDEAFALECKVHGKKLTLKQREKILKNCKIARSALNLPLLGRLKKYSYQSWLISQRLRNQFKDVDLFQYPAIPIPPTQNPTNSIDGTESRRNKNNNNNESSTSVTKKLKKLNRKAHHRRSETRFQNAEEFSTDDESSGRKKIAKNESNIVAMNVDGKKNKPSADKLPDESDIASTSSLTETGTNSMATTSRGSCEDTESVDSSIKNTFANRKNCARSIPSQNRVLSVVNKRNVVDVMNENSEIRNREVPESVKIMNNNKEAATRGGGGGEEEKENYDKNVSEELSLESVPSSPQPGPSRLSLELKSWREKRRRNNARAMKEQKSASECVGLVGNDNDSENSFVKEPIKHRRADERFSSMNKPEIVEKTRTNMDSTNSNTAKPEPNARLRKFYEWFNNPAVRERENAERFDKFYEKRSAELYEKLTRETRISILSEISQSTISSVEVNRPAKMLMPSRTERVTLRENDNDHLLTSDDSFE